MELSAFGKRSNAMNSNLPLPEKEDVQSMDPASPEIRLKTWRLGIFFFLDKVSDQRGTEKKM